MFLVYTEPVAEVTVIEVQRVATHPLQFGYGWGRLAASQPFHAASPTI